MESKDFDELLNQVREIGPFLRTLFRDVTGEDLDIESAVRHYPVLALGLAGGAGIVAGLWLGRKQRPALPPPPKSDVDGFFDRVRDLGSRLKTDGPPGQPSNHPLDRMLPDGLDRMRELLPDAISEEITEAARTWVDGVLEPRLKEGLESLSANVSQTRFGSYVKQALQRLEEDHGLEDPEES
jgi:hypothetical protein